MAVKNLGKKSSKRQAFWDFLLLRNRKGQVESQFNWIFILIAGAVILMFFVGVVMRQKAISETKISETVMTDLQSIFTGGSVSTGTSQLIETPKIEIGFDCANYYLNGVTKPVENLIIFSPTRVEGRNVLTWTLDYNMPYKVTNFLYITSPEVRYIFVGQDTWLRKMNATLPKEMNKEFYTIGDYDPTVNGIQDKNNYKVRIIFRGTIPRVPSNLEDMGKDLTALEIQGNILTFHEYVGGDFDRQGTDDTYTVDIPGHHEPSLYGAIFADDVEMYDCMMQKALKRAYFVSRVYAQRNRNLSEFFDATNSYCGIYEMNPDSFDIYSESIKDVYENFESLTASPGITETAQEITFQNKVLLQKSCPLIY